MNRLSRNAQVRSQVLGKAGPEEPVARTRKCVSRHQRVQCRIVPGSGLVRFCVVPLAGTNFRQRVLGLFLSVLAGCFAAACGSDDPDARGRFERPSGLLHLTRSSARGDLFIADSEAQGVRVLQYLKTDGGVRAAFVLAPSIFFPLVIFAPGFPVRLAAFPEATDRIFALAPARREVHVLEVAEQPFGVGGSSVSNVPLGSISLEGVVPEDAVPVNLAALFTRADGKQVLGVLFDRLGGAEPSGLLAVLVLTPTETGASFDRAELESVEILGGPREMVVRDEVVLVSSAATSSVSMVPLSRQARPILGSPEFLFAGGPTSSLIDVKAEDPGPDRGALALRLDTFSAVSFSHEGGRFRRADPTVSYPFSTDRTLLSGEIQLKASVPVAGAHGRVNFLGSSTSTTTAPNLLLPSDYADDGLADVVMITHLDGTTTFLTGSPFRVVMTSSTSVGRVTRLRGDLVVEGCSEPSHETCQVGTAGPETPECADGIVRQVTLTQETYRATYRGPLAQGRSGNIQLVATATPAFELLDPAVTSFVERQVVPGDRALVQGDQLCADGVRREFQEEGTVTAVLEDRLGVELGFVPCTGSAIRVAVYEVYPNGEEMVLTRVFNDLIGEVVERVPVQGSTATFSSQLGMRVVAGDGFACEVSANLGAPCRTSTDCGSGRNCQAPVERQLDSCPRFCEVACIQNASRCLKEEVVRACSQLELVVRPALPFSLDLAQRTTDVNLLRPAAPDQVVFSDVRRSWIVSLPGARGLAEARWFDDIRGFIVDHLR